MSLDSSIRLNKYISDSGHCSRREADKLIENNRVRVNGRRPEVGTRVMPGDEVTVDGMAIFSSAANKSDRVYIVYNKPVGVTCTTEQNVKGNIVDAVDHDERVFPIGRLDKPSEGLILLTSDGDIVNKILRAENAHDKEYLVTVNKPIGPGFAEKMSSGIPILGTITKPCKVTVQGKSTFKIILTQGLNRQIRRMCEYLGYNVVQLKRLRIMHIELGNLREGQWRNLTRVEMTKLNDAISSSSSESNVKSKRGSSSTNKTRSKSSHHSASQSKRSDKRTGSSSKAEGKSRSNTHRGKAGSNQQDKGKAASRGKSSQKQGGRSGSARGQHASSKISGSSRKPDGRTRRSKR